MSSESDATGAEGPTQDTGPSGEHPGEQAAVPPLVKILKNHTFVTPGQAERVPMTVRNVSGIVESFSLTPIGPSAPWVEVLPTEVSLFPGDEGTATITFRPPRVPGVVAGEYVVAIRALSQVMRDSASTDELLVTVAPYYQASSDIARSTFTVRTKAETQLEIVNRGNATVVYHVSAVDPEGYMKVELEEDKVSLAPGETAWVTLRLKLAPRLLGTANENRMVTAQIVPVRNADTDAPIVDVEPMVQRVTVLHKPFITLRRGWFGRIVFLITILALIMAVVFARVRANTPPENSGAPPVPVNFSATLNDSQQPVLTWDPSSGATTYSIYAIGTAGDPTTGSSPAAKPITNPVPAVNPTSSTPSNSASPSAVDAPERPSPVCNNCSEVSTVPAGTTRFVVTDAPPGYDCYRIAAKVGTTQSLFSPRTCLVVPGANILADTNGSAILTPDRQLQTTSPSPTPTTPTVIAPCPPVEVKAQAIPGGGVALLWKKAEVPPKGMVAPSAVATSALATASAVPAKPPAPAKVCDPAKAITGWTAQQQLFSGWSDVTPSGQPNDTALQVADLRPGTEYCFRMRADAADGSSVYAKVVCAKTAGAANPPPLAPNAPAASPSTSAPVG